MVNRRQLFKWSFVSGAIAIVTGCFGGESGTAQGGRIQIGKLSDLKKAGSLSKKTKAGPVVLVATETGVSAVNPTCTHSGCTVKWQKGQSQFVCPCHGAKYASSGKKLSGPAPRSLGTYPTQVEGDTIFISG